jgi:glycosyltransferase involved in cell wall biosynthesis
MTNEKMKIALGIIVRNQREFLEKTLPTYSFSFEHRFAVDFFSDDYTREILDQFGFVVHRQEWPNNFATARNILIQCAEEAGMDYLIMLDADEALDRNQVIKLQKYAHDFDAIVMPRIEFVQDTDHFDDHLFPDFQLRAFKLNKGYHYKNKIHEMLHDKSGVALMGVRGGRTKKHRILTVPDVFLYHYGRTADKAQLVLKYINYDRQIKGESKLEKLPDGYNLDDAQLWQNMTEFYGPHPLKGLK